jgi:serine/threonine protein kinase
VQSVEPGSVVAGYRIESVVARGGMGVVYRATQLALDRPVALKVIAPEAAGDPSFRERFQRESRLAASIDHPNVIPVHEAGEHDGLLYITMRLVDGIDLGRLIASEGRLSLERTSRILTQVAAALDAAHSRGLVHRDVKPANILVARDDHVYLTDFGLVKSVTSDSGPTQTGQVVGTVNYVAPETIHGRGSDARSDVYALGCVVFQMLTGYVPFERETPVATMWAHSSEPPPPLPAATGDGSMASVDEVIARSLAKEPDDRFQSAGDMARAFAAAVSGVPVAAPERSVARGDAAPDGASTPQTVIDSPSGPTRPLEGATAATDAVEDTPTATKGLTSATPTPSSGGGVPASRKFLLTAAAVLAVIVVGVVLVTLLGGGGDDEPKNALESDSFSISTSEVGGEPRGIAVGEGGVWVADYDRDTVTKLDDSGKPDGKPIPVPDDPIAIEAGEGYVWVLSTGSDYVVTRIDPSREEVSGKPIKVEIGADNIEVGEGAVWVADNTQVTRIDPEENRVVAKVPIEGGFDGMAVGEGYVWVTGDSITPALTRIDAETNKPVPTGDVALEGTIVAGYGYGWGFEEVSVDSTDTRLIRIDPATGNKIGNGVEFSRTGLDVGASAIWSIDTSNGFITRIDPKTGRPVPGDARVSVPSEAGYAVGDDAVWVTQPGAGTVTRVGF